MSILGKSSGQDSQVGGKPLILSSAFFPKKEGIYCKGPSLSTMFECTFNFPFRNTVKPTGPGDSKIEYCK